MGTIHMVLSYGQNDGKFGGRPFDQVPADEIRRRTMGAQGVLASRVFYAALYVRESQTIHFVKLIF